MHIMDLAIKMDAIEANAGMIKEEDKEFLNEINRQLNGLETMMITGKDQQRIADIHAEMFSRTK